MHELAVVLDIVCIMKEESQKRGFTKITRIDLVIGELSAVIDESVQMYFEIMAKDSACADAILKFEHRPAMLECSNCGMKFPHEKSFACPACGGDSILIKDTGHEFYIQSFNGE